VGSVIDFGDGFAFREESINNDILSHTDVF